MGYNATHNRRRWHRAIHAGSLAAAIRILLGVRPHGTPLETGWCL